MLRAIVVLVALQRLAELAWSGRNANRLRRRGAVERDPGGHRWFVLLHAGWLAGLWLAPSAKPVWPLLGLFAALQAGRVWVMLSLGRFWTTRVLSLPGTPLVRTGPYRWLRHPNYLLVTAEIAVLPLAFGAYPVAAIGSALNLVLIFRRIRIEDRVLAARRGR